MAASIISAMRGFAKPLRIASGSLGPRGKTSATFVAMASAISRPYFGTTTVDALMHERPPFAEIEVAMTSMYSRQFSMQSFPMMIFDQPGPWTSTPGLDAYF